MATPIPRNGARFSLLEIERLTGGSLSGAEGDLEVQEISTDTRALGEGAAFVALRGPHFDGHAHLDAARRAGARAALVERGAFSGEAPPGLAIVRVESTLAALGALAAEHVRRWRARPAAGGERRVVGITGSAGKTTTRVVLAALLDVLAPGAVHASTGNLNNLVGVPMILLGLADPHRFAVVEMGTNRPGEIAALARMARPDAGVVTLVAAAHTEGLGGLEGVAVEKGALFEALSEEGSALANADDPRVVAALERSPARRRVRYGRAQGADVRIAERRPVGLARARLVLEIAPIEGRGAPRRLELDSPLLGEAGALAAAAALATVERALGLGPVPAEALALALERAATDLGDRLSPRLAGDVVLVDDSYNANPASMKASIRAASEIARAEGRRLVLALGEMRELGAESAELHREIGEAAAESGAVLTLGVAGDAARLVEACRAAGAEALFAEDAAAAARALLPRLEPGDLVLVKGSRGVGTEAIARAILDARGTERGAGGRA